MTKQTKSWLVNELIREVRASRAAVDQLDDAAARALGVNRTDVRCLDIIDREGPVAAGRLADLSGLTTAAVTAVVDRLERSGYVRRLRDSSDRRRVLVELTPLERERATAIWGPLREGFAKLSEYTTEELELLLAFHRRGRELDEQRAAKVRELRFTPPRKAP